MLWLSISVLFCTFTNLFKDLFPHTDEFDEVQGGVDIVVVLDPAHGTATVAAEEREEEEDGTNAESLGDTHQRGKLRQDHDKDAELSRRFRTRCEIMGRAMELLHSGVELQSERDRDALCRDALSKCWSMPPLGRVQGIRTLRELGVKVITCEQEADGLLPAILEVRESCLNTLAFSLLQSLDFCTPCFRFFFLITRHEPLYHCMRTIQCWPTWTPLICEPYSAGRHEPRYHCMRTTPCCLHRHSESLKVVEPYMWMAAPSSC